MMEEQTTLEGAHLHTSCVRRNCGAVLDFFILGSLVGRAQGQNAKAARRRTITLIYIA